jgi:multicomponent Na+:H+ antiporter subunit E
MFLACFIFYLVLTAGSGTASDGCSCLFLFEGVPFLWSFSEVGAGFFFSLVVAFVGRHLVHWKFSNKAVNPWRWFLFFFYLVGPFFFQLIKANVEVAYMIITGKINPGIVKIKPDVKTDLGVVMVANSITLTPGTLTIDVGDKNELYVHWLNVTKKKPKPEDVYGSIGKWVKKVME